MSGYTEDQEGFSQKMVKWMHKWMYKARRPDQAERGARESIRGLEQKTYSSSNPPFPKYFYGGKTKEM